MEELRYKKLDEINIDSKLVVSGAFKPYKSVAIIGVAGIGLLFLKSIYMKLLGLFFVAIALFVFFFVEDKKTIDVYESGCLIYNSKDSTLAYFINFNDIEEWDVSHEGGHDTIEFTLLDRNKAIVDTFQTTKIYNALEKIVPEKSHMAIQAKRNKELNISPIDALKNLVKKKK